MSLFHFDHILPLPLHFFGLKNIPGVPVVVDEWLDTLAKLAAREIETRSAKNGLTNTYTIGGQIATAHTFLFGGTPLNVAQKARDDLAQVVRENPMHAAASLYAKIASPAGNLAASGAATADPLTSLSLDDPAQFALSWTAFQDIAQNAQPLLPEWAATLTDPAIAAKRFWPTIASCGLPYNLLVLQKIDAAKVSALKARFQGSWTPAFDALVASGTLYAIDLSLFTALKPQQAGGFTRFTPATITLLQQNPVTKDLTPIAVWVAGYQGAGAQVFAPGAATTAAWLYALQAAKTSVTLYGIWLGHVYHWHIVTAALQMGALNHLEENTPLYQLVAPQSNYLLAFDNVLLLLWEAIAPPTSITSATQFLELCNTFAAGRTFFDDDPLVTIQKLGLRQADFTVTTPWDKYPLVARLLQVWNATTDYVNAFVDASYATDAAVANDAALQAWMAAAAKPDNGNIQGLPPMNTKDALRRVLTSFLYRITMHGCSRLPPIANPGLTFVANFPPCLQDATIPAPTANFDTRRLLQYLPKTGTIGSMLTFYYIFGFSVPYVSFIPLTGFETNLFFPGGLTDARNQALVKFRHAIATVMTEIYGKSAPQLTQWPLNIET